MGTGEEMEKVQGFYRSRFERFGHDARSLDMSLPSQQLRFRVLSGVGDLRGTSVLDVGCGFGDYFEYLEKEHISTQYTGLDISPEFVKEGASRHPGAKFYQTDIGNFHAEGGFDYVMASGTFNVRFREDQEAWTLKTLEKMFSLCRKGMAVSLISTWADSSHHRDDIFYFSPERTFEFCKSLTRWVVLRHEYMPHDFTIYLYKENQEVA